MIKIITLLILVTVPFSFSREKCLIYFKDKGIPESAALSKASVEYNEALSQLSERAIERRKKTMGENFITYEDIPVSRKYLSQLESMGIEIVHELKWFNCVSAYLTEAQRTEIKNLPFVEKIDYVREIKFDRKEDDDVNYLEKPSGTFAEIGYGESFGQLELSDIPVVHSNGITGQGIILGLLDSGFDWQRHESLQTRNVLDEHDFIFNDNVTANESEDAFNQHNHGTTIFSVAGGFKDSTMVGVAFGADFLLAKTEYIPSETHIEEDNYAAALIWMEERGVDVTSSSLGYSEFDAGEGDYTYSDMNGHTTIVTNAVNEAFERGILTLTAGGNEGNNPWHYITAPADAFDVIAVGAVNSSNQVASFSGRGPTSDGRIKPDVTAQGVSVYGAVASTVSNYSRSNGTSLSTPIASGIATLLLSAYPHLTNVQARKILIETAGNASNPNNEIGYGLLSAARAISYPNLQFIENAYRLNKAFIDKTGIDSTSITLHYSINSGDYEEVVLIKDDYRYSFDFPVLDNNNSIDFYYTYSDAAGNSLREPETGAYHFDYGQTEIVVGVDNENIPDDYVLSQNYPNPFNSQTKINFVAGLNEKAELIIIDGIGQRIKMLFDGLTKNGTNTVIWDGKTENGITAASGVYYYILKLSGKEYGRKMILLK